MAEIDIKYHHLLTKILKEGFTYEDPNRKGVNRIQVQDYRFEHSFKDGFPAITTKKLAWKSVVGELIWFLRGDTNIQYLLNNNISIWSKDGYNYYLRKCKEDHWIPLSYADWKKEVKNRSENIWDTRVKNRNAGGDLGRIYGAQWRKWDNGYSGKSHLDQISNLIEGLKKNPMGTKHIVTAWNPAELDGMALPPCHWSFEILVKPLHKMKKKLMLTQIKSPKDIDKIPIYEFTLKWHQRSVDTFLGLPFNIASYALLAQIIGKITNMVPIGIIGDLSNVHIYEPHLDAVKEQLKNNPNKYDKCELHILDEFHYLTDEDFVGKLSTNHIISELRIDMFDLNGYKSYPPIKTEMLSYNQ